MRRTPSAAAGPRTHTYTHTHTHTLSLTHAHTHTRTHFFNGHVQPTADLATGKPEGKNSPGPWPEACQDLL